MTRLGQTIRVETLDDERYARIEQRVMSAFDTRSGSMGAPGPSRRSWAQTLRQSSRWLVPAVALAGVVLMIYLNVRSSASREQMSAEGAAPTRIVTDDSGASTYHLGDATVVVGPNTTVEISRAASGAIDLELIAGQVDCQVEPRPGRARFAVHAGDVDVTVVGTAFQVERTRAPQGGHDGMGDAVRVLVTRGKVRVDSKEGTRLLGAGQSWTGPALMAALSAPGRSTSVQPGADQGTSRGVDEGADRGVDEGADRGVDEGADRGVDQGASRAGGHGADMESSASPASTARERDATGIASAKRDLDVDVDSPGREALRERTARKPPAGGADRDRSTADSTRERASRHRDPSRRALAGAMPARPAPQANGELADIMALEANDPGKAVARYSEIALSRGADAAFALYSMAYVQYFQLGQRDAALRSVSHYQRRFPRGVHAESVLWLRIRILCEDDDRDACRAAAHTYLNSYPKGRHATRAGQIVNWDM
jgi:hypothetical protein